MKKVGLWSLVLLAAVLVVPLVLQGCGGHRDCYADNNACYRPYAPYHYYTGANYSSRSNCGSCSPRYTRCCPYYYW